MSGPIWPSIEAENFELRPGLIALVQQSQFRGLPNEDPHKHICNVLEFASTVQYHGVSHDAIKCMLFTFSLRDGAKNWYYSLPSRSFTWSEISHAFLDRYFPLYKQAAIREQILSFSQDGSESLYAAWERYRYFLRKCPNHGLKDWFVLQIFYRGLTSASRDLIDMSAGGSIMNKTVEGATNLIESIAFHQMQWGYEKPSSDEKVASCVQLEALSPIPEQKTCLAPIMQNHQILSSGQQQFRTSPDPPLNKNELTPIIFDDDYDVVHDDTAIVDHMDDRIAESIPHADAIVLIDSKLQEDAEKEPTLVDADLREQEMDRFTCTTQLSDWWNLAVTPITHACVAAATRLFDRGKVSTASVAATCVIDEEDTLQKDNEAENHITQLDHMSECLQFEAMPVCLESMDNCDDATEDQEQEMGSSTIEEAICLGSLTGSSDLEILSTDEDRASLDDNEEDIAPERPAGRIDIILQEVVSPSNFTSPPREIEWRYELPLLEKPYPTNRTVNNINMERYNPHKKFYVCITLSCMENLVGINPVTCASFSFCEYTFRFLLVHHQLRPNMVRVDIPWDPGGFKAW